MTLPPDTSRDDLVLLERRCAERQRSICSATALEVAAYVSDHVVLRYASW
jgi:hypothetical protein